MEVGDYCRLSSRVLSDCVDDPLVPGRLLAHPGHGLMSYGPVVWKGTLSGGLFHVKSHHSSLLSALTLVVSDVSI